MCASKISLATGTRPGCATQVPSCPAFTSRSLSCRTFSSAFSLAAGSFLMGICAAMPPMAWMPRRWQVWISRSHIGLQEMPVHGDHGAVGQHEVGPVAEFLDEAENVVPAAAVQPGGVFAQFVEDLVHLERGQDGFDQHRGANGAARNAQLILRET